MSKRRKSGTGGILSTPRSFFDHESVGMDTPRTYERNQRNRESVGRGSGNKSFWSNSDGISTSRSQGSRCVEMPIPWEHDPRMQSLRRLSSSEYPTWKRDPTKTYKGMDKKEEVDRIFGTYTGYYILPGISDNMLPPGMFAGEEAPDDQTIVEAVIRDNIAMPHYFLALSIAEQYDSQFGCLSMFNQLITRAFLREVAFAKKMDSGKGRSYFRVRAKEYSECIVRSGNFSEEALTSVEKIIEILRQGSFSDSLYADEIARAAHLEERL